MNSRKLSVISYRSSTVLRMIKRLTCTSFCCPMSTCECKPSIESPRCAHPSDVHDQRPGFQWLHSMLNQGIALDLLQRGLAPHHHTLGCKKLYLRETEQSKLAAELPDKHNRWAISFLEIGNSNVSGNSRHLAIKADSFDVVPVQQFLNHLRRRVSLIIVRIDDAYSQVIIDVPIIQTC